MIVQPVGVERFDSRRRGFVKLLATPEQQRLVSHLQRERVLEDVFDLGKRRLLVDELGKLKVGKHPVQFVVRLARPLS